MSKKVSAIVLSSANYGESDKILTLLTPNGCESVYCKGARKQSAKLRFATETFCFGEYELSISKGGMYILSGCELIDMFYELRLDIKKFYLASFIAECQKTISLSCDDTERELVFTLKTFRALLSCQNDFYFVYAVVKLIESSGYGICYKTCASCGGELGNALGFSTADGGFLCEKCRLKEVKKSFYKMVRFVSENDEDTVIKTAVEAEYTRESLALLARYCEDKLLVDCRSLRELIKLI